MTSKNSDEDIMKNVFQLRERLMQTETSLHKINRLADMDNTAQPGRMSLSDSFDPPNNDSVNLPPPLTLDDLGELNSRDVTVYSPVDENVLREWNMNSARSNSSNEKSFGRSINRTVSENFQVGNAIPRDIHITTEKLVGPSTSSPNLMRYGKPGNHAFSCDDLTSAIDLGVGLFEADSYRMIKQPSFTSHISMSAPISPRKSYSHASRRAPSPSHSDILDRHSTRFEHMHGFPSESSSSLANFTLLASKKSNKSFSSQDDSGDITLNETGKENVTPIKLTARSNATSVTVLGVDAENERLQGTLMILREDNSRLHHLVSELRHQMDTDKAQQAERYKQMLEKQEENILALKEEALANEKSLRKAEIALDQSEKARQKTSRAVTVLRDEISHLKSLLSESQVAQNRANSQHKEAFTDAQEMARRLELAQGRLEANGKCREEMEAKHKKEMQNQERLRTEISEKAAKLQYANTQLHSDLRKALSQLDENDNRSSKQANEKIYISRALQDLQEQFAELRTDFLKKSTELQKASEDRAALQQKLDDLTEQNRLQQDRLSSCQVELEDERSKVKQMEKDLQKSKQELLSRVYYGVSTGNTDSGRGGSVTYGEKCEDESPRKQNAVIAELKMKLASKEAQIQRLEARVNSFSMEAEKLEGIRGELINVVERSRLGDKRAHELEGIVHTLEDERAKVTRQLMEAEDMLNDKKAECESLEKRLKDRTKYLTSIQNDFNESQNKVSKLDSELKKKSLEHQKLTEQLEEKTLECESRYAALQRAEEELAEKRRSLENAVDWTGKRESESRRELEKIKKIHKEQHEEMEKQIEILQSECDRHRDQARELDCLVCQLRNENENYIQRLRKAESELEDARKTEESVREKDQHALDALQNKCKESSCQVTSLQKALDQCKTDIRQYVDQLEETSSKFQHQMAVKNSQVAKLESELKIAQDSLHSENLHVSALQANLTERKKTLQEMSEKISSVQESHTTLQSKLAKTEQILDRERAKLNQEREHWESRLQSACHELDAKNRQFMQLNEALKGVDKEFNSCRQELASVEQQLNKLRNDTEEKTLKLEKSQADANNAKTQLLSKTEKIASLEDKLTASESTRKELHEKCLSLEMELARHQGDILSYSQKSNQLQAALDSNNMDSAKKDTIISRLQIALKEAKEQVTKSERKNEDFERALEERQWELQQRATQLGNLEINLREHKCNAEKKLLELQSEVRKSQIELKERNSQVSKLDEQLTTYREDISEARHLLDEKEQDLRRLSREIDQKVERCQDLEKALDDSRTAYEERHRTYLEVTQELRVTREQSQRSAQQWQDAQRELTRLQHQQHDLINDLKEMGENEKQKEGHVSELSAKLTDALAQKNALEEKYGGELERMRKDVLKLHQQHQDEIRKLRSRHSQELVNAKTQEGDRSEELRSALERENQMKQECEAMRELVMSLENELLARKQVIEAANDTIVVKEAEIARLEAKLSGIERGEKLKVMHTTPVKPLHSTVKRNKDRYNVEDDEHPDFLPSFLVQDLDHRKNVVKTSPDPARPTSTLFSGLDPDSGSLDPSFLDIASSPSKKPAADVLHTKDLATSRVSYLNNTNDYSDVDDSLFARVFEANDEIHTENLNTTPRDDMVYTSDERGQHNTVTSTSATLHFGLGGSLRPEQCMADLQERLRASEQRRQQVTSKLRQLKSSKEST